MKKVVIYVGHTCGDEFFEDIKKDNTIVRIHKDYVNTKDLEIGDKVRFVMQKIPKKND